MISLFSFIQYSLNRYFIPRTVLGFEGISVKKKRSYKSFFFVLIEIAFYGSNILVLKVQTSRNHHGPNKLENLSETRNMHIMSSSCMPVGTLKFQI